MRRFDERGAIAFSLTGGVSSGQWCLADTAAPVRRLDCGNATCRPLRGPAPIDLAPSETRDIVFLSGQSRKRRGTSVHDRYRSPSRALRLG